MTLDLTLPANYLVDTAPGWPEQDEPVYRFGPQTGAAGYLSIRFFPTGQQSWFGEFGWPSDLGGGLHLSSTSDPDRLLLAFGTELFALNVRTQQCTVRDDGPAPVLQLKADPYRRCIWAVDFTNAYALASDGRILWASQRLALDDLYLAHLTEKTGLFRGRDLGGDDSMVHSIVPLPTAFDGGI